MMTAGIALSDPAVAQAALQGLQAADEAILQRARARGRPLPALYRSGVRYQREAPGSESWDTADRVLRRGYGDCEDLAAWRAAELVVSGGDPLARVIIVPTSSRRTLHAVVRRGDGRIEDPSRRLGMGAGPELGYVIGAAPAAGDIAYRIETTPAGYLVRVHRGGAPPQHAISSPATMLAAMKAAPAGPLAMLQAQQAATASPAAKAAAAAALAKAPPATKAKAKSAAKSAAMKFVRKALKAAAPIAASAAANAIAPGSGALVGPLAAAALK